MHAEKNLNFSILRTTMLSVQRRLIYAGLGVAGCLAGIFTYKTTSNQSLDDKEANTSISMPDERSVYEHEEDIGISARSPLEEIASGGNLSNVGLSKNELFDDDKGENESGEDRYGLWSKIEEYLAYASKMADYDEQRMTEVVRSIGDEISALDYMDCDTNEDAVKGILISDCAFVLPGLPGRGDFRYYSNILDGRGNYTIELWSEDERVVGAFRDSFSPEGRPPVSPYFSFILNANLRGNQLEWARVTIEIGSYRHGGYAPISKTTFDLSNENEEGYLPAFIIGPLLENLGPVIEKKIRAGQK